MRILLTFLAFLLLAANVDAARITRTPEVPGLSCATGKDADGDNKIGAADPDCGASSPLSANGNGFRAHAKDAAKTGYTTASDALSSSGTYLKKTTTAGEAVGEVSWWGDWTAGNYYGWILYRCSQTTCTAWFSESEIGKNMDNATMAMIFPQAATWTWTPIRFTGSNANFRAGLNGGGVRTFTMPTGRAGIYMKSVDGLEVDCVDFDPDSNNDPDCPSGGGGQPAANYVILELGAEVAPTSCASAAFTHANQMALSGFDSTTSLGTTVVKMLWDNNTTDMGYGCVTTLDTDDEIASTTNDVFSTSEDNVDFRWRLDQSQTFDSNMRMVVGNLQPIYADADWSGVDNTRTFTPNFNTTVARTVVPATSWNIFFSFEAGSVTPGTIGLCNLVIRDKDSGVATTARHFFGTTVNAMLNANEFGLCEWSNTAVPASGGGGDVTAPSVTSCTSQNITTTSFTGQCTSNEAGTATLKRDTDNDNAVSGADMVTIAGGSIGATTFTVAATGLTPGTAYEWKMEVQDAAGNIGTGAVVDVTTTALTGTHFVGPSATGSGNCIDISNKCLLHNAWKAARGAHRDVAAGDTIIMDDGTYTGASSMLTPDSGINGTAANRITVKALNDGAVTIDGQNARRPVILVNNDYFILEGFNAHSSLGGAVVSLGTGADNNIVRRVVAWDAPENDNAMVFNVSENTGNLLEDIGGFGKGRKIVGIIGTNNLTVRRAWGAWQKNTIVGPKITFTNDYDSAGAIFENLIGTWKSEMGATGVNQPIGILGTDGNVPAGECNNNHYYGSIAYLRSSDIAVTFDGLARSNNDSDCAKFQDIVTYIEPGTHTNLRPVSLLNISGATATQRFYTNATEIGGTTASTVGSQWTVTNRKTYATTSAMNADTGNPFLAAAGNGARVCFRYENGTLTSTKLWPWPMDSRIGAAWDVRNGAGASLAEFGSLTTPVTTTMETIFGTIPAACKS